MAHWTTSTPDGRRLVVTRERDRWTVICGRSESAPHELLDVALTEAIRHDHPAGRSVQRDYATWIRELADQIERGERRPGVDRRKGVGNPRGVGELPAACELRATRAQILPSPIGPFSA
jgi:hypothetical protein